MAIPSRRAAALVFQHGRHELNHSAQNGGALTAGGDGGGQLLLGPAETDISFISGLSPEGAVKN